MKKAAIFYIVGSIILTVLFLMMTGCGVQTKVVTEYRDRVTHDTVARVDSVYVSRYIREKGDTVRIIDTIFQYKILERVRDSYVHDSIPYAVEVQVPVRKRNSYDRFVSWGFWILVVLIIIRVAWWAFKTFYLRKS